MWFFYKFRYESLWLNFEKWKIYCAITSSSNIKCEKAVKTLREAKNCKIYPCQWKIHKGKSLQSPIPSKAREKYVKEKLFHIQKLSHTITDGNAKMSLSIFHWRIFTRGWIYLLFTGSELPFCCDAFCYVLMRFHSVVRKIDINFP